MNLVCGNCGRCPAGWRGLCSGCPGCRRPLLGCVPEARRCGRCPYVCPDRPGLAAYVNSHLGGTLELEPVAVRRAARLPAHLPLVATRLHERPPEGLSPWYALHAGKVSGGLWRSGGFRRAYNLPEGAGLALSLYVDDASLERFWQRRRERYGVIAAEFDVAFAPNFSVYEDAPRMEHLLNMRRSNIVAAEMTRLGIAVVPDVSWYCKEDLDRWAALAGESRVPAVAFSFQTVGRENKGSGAWRAYLAGLRYLCGRLPAGVRVVVVGANSAEKISAVLGAVGGRDVSFLDTLSFYAARKGGVVTASGRERAPEGTSRDAAFFASVRAFRARLAAAGAD
ncbi:DUF4417 domain-containing protein [Desulfovirgula thermocuniculi]|uniref:DUF4417 domain-containing protein n=1 Tax=Desulfovirgula thermocuniculi TaxID=348842 RepID=UPI0003FF9B47|nr:DUF4417 domain-containing protein [Desulfovirgula thermocuniculi]